MKKMFKEKLRTLEMENNVLKEKARKSGYSRTERNSMSQSRKTKDESEIKIVESSRKSSGSSATSSSKTVSSSKAKRSKQREKFSQTQRGRKEENDQQD